MTIGKFKIYVKVFIFLFLSLRCSSTSEENDGNNVSVIDNPIIIQDGADNLPDFVDENNSDANEDNTDTSGCVEFNFSPAFDMEVSFRNWQNSPYHLPYKKGETYLVIQGNSTGFCHSAFWRFGYDFDLDIGTEVYCARSGRVLFMSESAADGDSNSTNLITVEHNDGTVALYSHLTKNGSFVEIGDLVNRGQRIGLSGNTGNTGGIPHLHFSVHPCAGLPGLPNETNCPTLPANFSNTEANPNGLGTGHCYTAN